MLDERYGDPFVIGNAFRNKFEKWPKILSRDNIAFRKFSDFLKQCLSAINTMNTLNVMNDDRENRKLLAKMPDWIVTRWASIVHKYEEDYKMFPPFKCFVDFISTEAEIASDQVTSLQSFKPEDRVSRLSTFKPTKKLEGRSFAAETTIHF